jgi:hypothetical protein
MKVEATGAAPWSAFRREAPELAGEVRSRFEANLHHVLGTIRAGGPPRLSGTEVQFDDDHVRIGMMDRAQKLADVRRDPRVELHSAPIDDQLREGDAKLGGVLVDAGAVDGPIEGTMFALLIERVSLVRVAGDELVFLTWAPGRGVRELRRR